MSDSRVQDRWSDADLDRALEFTLQQSPVRAEGIERVRAAVAQASGVDLGLRHKGSHTNFQPDDRREEAPNSTTRAGAPPRDQTGTRMSSERRRRRSGLVLAATVAAVGLAVGVPWLVLQNGGQRSPAVSASAAPLTAADCAQHNKIAGPDPAEAGEPGQTMQPLEDGWYSPGKAAQLTSTLRSALPADSCVFLGSGWGNLTFGPSLNPGGTDGAPYVGTLDTQAAGRLVTDRGDGPLSVSIFRSGGSDSCIAGSYDDKTTAADGTVTWQLTSSVKSADTSWIVLVVTTYRTDGTCSVIRVSDEVLGSDAAAPPKPGMTASGRLPLTLDELTQMARTPGLDVET